MSPSPGDVIAVPKRSRYFVCWVHAQRMIDVSGSHETMLRSRSRLPFHNTSRRRNRRPGDRSSRARRAGRSAPRRGVRPAGTCRSQRSPPPTPAARHHRRSSGPMVEPAIEPRAPTQVADVSSRDRRRRVRRSAGSHRHLGSRRSCREPVRWRRSARHGTVRGPGRAGRRRGVRHARPPRAPDS